MSELLEKPPVASLGLCGELKRLLEQEARHRDLFRAVLDLINSPRVSTELVSAKVLLLRHLVYFPRPDAVIDAFVPNMAQ